MGQLIVMASRNTEQNGDQAASRKATPVSTAALNELPPSLNAPIDFSVWMTAPRERTPNYFPTYSAVSRAMQSTMRGWVGEWLAANPEILKRPHTAYAILVYLCTHPFSGRPTNIFTYEIQDTKSLNRAFRSAGSKLGRHLKKLDTKRFGWFTRQHYFAYRSKEVVAYVFKNPRVIYRMLHVETILMDSILKFAIMDLPTIGEKEALVKLRRSFNVQLHRFSEQFDLSTRSEELLRIATNALIAKMAADAAAQILQAA